MSPSSSARLACLVVLVTELPRLLANGGSYCMWQTFPARCASHSVILMKTALYGRMEAGHCIQRDYGYVGCYNDVLHLADVECSGRRQCDIQIPFQRFYNVSICPADLHHYFKAEYECVEVYSPTKPCVGRSLATHPLPTPVGWFASSTTRETGCGSPDAPWAIQAKPGQIINFTLFDFALNSAVRSPQPSSQVVYMIFKESHESRPTTGLGGRERVSQVYLSASNYVEVRVMQNVASDRHFVVKYEVLGCADMTSPLWGWVRRENNEVTVGCHHNKATWTLRCEGHSWSGQAGNCSAPVSASVGFRFTQTLSILVILAVAFAIGVLILVSGLFCLRRKRRRSRANRARTTFTPLGGQGYKDEMNYKTTSTTFTGYSQPSFTPRTDTSGENDYEYVDDIKPPPPVMDAGSTFGKVKVTGHSCSAHGAHTTNQYGFDGTVDFHKMKRIPSGGSAFTPHGPGRNPACAFPQYYELDPSRDPTGQASPTRSGGQSSQNPASLVTRAFSEDPTDTANQRQANLNFGHYSQ